MKIRILNDVFQEDWLNSGDGIAEMKWKVDTHEISLFLLIGHKKKFFRAENLKKAKITVDGKTVPDWHPISSGTQDAVSHSPDPTD